LPLVTDNIDEARAAYSALETRAQGAENLARTLKAELDKARAARPPLGIQEAHDIRQVVLNREADNERLRIQLQQAIVTRADLPLESFIASLGMAAAVGEATMPDRTVSSLSATVQSYVTPSDTSVGLRFFQPGVDTHLETLSSTSLELARVPPPTGVPSPRSFYNVMLGKQSVYSDPFWAQFTTNSTPPGQPANDIVVAASTALANAGSWSFASLLQSAIAIGTSEKSLADLASSKLPGKAASSYSTAVTSLLALTTALSNKSLPVAGDLLSLAASLDTITRVARTLLA
jgi:hypothetical protein